GLTTPASLTSLAVAGGGNLSLASGAGQTMSGLSSLSLGAGSGTTTLELDAGDSGVDLFDLTSGTVTATNSISFLIKDVDLSNNSNYTLIMAPGGGLTSGGATYSFS
ncbi:MAG: hypothetical protein ACK53L_19610, partial [Pirellulaceae bacterium]